MADRIIDVIVNGAFLTKNSKNAGVQNEGNVTTLHIVMDDSWAGYGKRIVWRNALGENPVSLILYEPVEGVENLEFRTTIPREALDQPGWCSFTIEGYQEVDGVHKASLTVRDFLQVLPNDSFYSPAEPTPDVAEQIMEKMGEAIDTIASFSTTAKSWAVGGTGSRDGEDTDNAMYYSLQSKEQVSLAESQVSLAREQVLFAQEQAEEAKNQVSLAENQVLLAKEQVLIAQDARDGADEARLGAEHAKKEAEVILAEIEKAPATAQLYHDRLRNRNLPDQHPMESITGLIDELDKIPLFYVIEDRTRDPSKPDYGLYAEGERYVSLNVDPYTGGSEVSAIVSGAEYDVHNLSANDHGGNGTILFREMEE